MAQKDSEQKLLDLRMLEARLEALAKHREFVATRILEIDTTVNSIDEISKANSNVIFHVGGEAFMPASPSKEGKVIVMIGADVAMEKDVSDAKNILASRRKEAEDALKQVQSEMEALNKKIESAAMSIEAESA